MKRVLRFLGIPAALFVGIWLGTTMQSAETTYWHNMAYRISQNFENTSTLSSQEFGVCLDVVEGSISYEEGTERLLELDSLMDVERAEYSDILNELDKK